MNNCDVSVVIPYYFADKTIERAIDSIDKQTLQPAEVIIINDNGDDKHDEFLNKLVFTYNKLRIVLVKNEINMGAAYSRNVGWEKASGKYIAFLDSDDAWAIDKLRLQYDFMELKKAVLCGHSINISNKKNKTEYTVVLLNTLLFRNIFPTPTVMVRRDIEYRFDPAKRYVDDHLLWIEICNAYPLEVFFLNKPLALVFKPMFGSSGLSSHLFQMEIGELDMYQKINRRHIIDRLLYVLLVSISILKFIRRLVISSIKKLL